MIKQINFIEILIFTIADDNINQLESIGKDLDLFSLETVEKFYNDARNSKFYI